MEEFQYGTAAVRKYIDIPVQGIQMARTDGTAQAVNALAQVYWIAAHYKTVVLIQVEHGFFEHKGRNFLKILKHGGFRMVTQLHEFAAGADEDEDIAVLHLIFHLLMYQPAQRTDPLAHIRSAGAQEVAHRVVQAKHGYLAGFGSTLPSVISQTRSRSGHGDR